MTQHLVICRLSSSRQAFLQLCAAHAGHGTALAVAPCNAQQLLEPGTPAQHVWVRAFEHPQAVDEALRALDESDEAAQGELQTLVVETTAIELEQELGVPLVSTHAGRHLEPWLKLIEGSVSDEEAIASYRDVIMPLLRDAGAHYLTYAWQDQVSVHHGDWDAQFLALSRWPGERAARGFWEGDRYQLAAIPIRANAGSFSVALFAAERWGAWRKADAKAVVRRFLESLWAGDKDAAKQTFAEDAQWWFLPSLGYQRPMHPSAAIDAVVDDMIGRFDAGRPFTVELHFLVAEEGEVFAEYTARATTIDGNPYEHRYVLHASVQDGRIQCVRPWADTRYFVDTLFAGESPASAVS